LLRWGKLIQKIKEDSKANIKSWLDFDFDSPFPFKQAEEGAIWAGFSARMSERVFYASSAAAVDIATDEGTLIVF